MPVHLPLEALSRTEVFKGAKEHLAEHKEKALKEFPRRTRTRRMEMHIEGRH